MWEDKANKNGGRWMITLNRQQRPELDRYWIDTVSLNAFHWIPKDFILNFFQVLCLIGEAFDSFDDICGAVVNIRAKGDKIGKLLRATNRQNITYIQFLFILAIWTSNSNNKDAVMEIGKKLKEGLNLPERLKIQYQTHSDSMVKNSSSVKSLYEI